VSPSPATLPLGVDIGQRRVRVALTGSVDGGPPKLLAVAGHNHDGDAAEALRWAIEDLQTQERRCVLALAEPDALLRPAEFPAMPPWERVSAARFEAARFIDYPIAEAAVSLVRTTARPRWAIGVVRRSALATALGVAKSARLRPLAVDDMAFALRRAHPDADAVIDVGNKATRLTIFGDTIPSVTRLPIGGETITDAIAQSLGVDAATAEERKRSVGFGGAGDAARDALIAALGEAFADERASGNAGIRNIVLCGNGSRIPGFASAIERATGYTVLPATLSPDCSDTLPPDLLRAAAPDWSIAYGLSLWSIVS
jgi:Tfp pilus assembly PilM family ATPase